MEKTPEATQTHRLRLTLPVFFRTPPGAAKGTITDLDIPRLSAAQRSHSGEKIKISKTI